MNISNIVILYSSTHTHIPSFYRSLQFHFLKLVVFIVNSVSNGGDCKEVGMATESRLGGTKPSV